MSGGTCGTCREQSSTDASDSSMCGSNCASRLERASGSSRKISRRKGNFPVAPIPVADIPRTHSFHSPVMSDDSGRNSREETTRSKGDKKSTPLGESGTTCCGEERKIPQPETLADSDTSDHRSRSGTIQTTTNGRLGNADFGLSALHRTESVSRERIPGMDDVSVMWSPLESKDGPGRHSGEDGTDNRTTSVDTPLPRMFLDDATTTDDKQHGSGSTTGDRSNVSRPTAEGQGEQGSSDLARHNAEDLNNAGVLQSVRVWTDKTDDNADTWEAAIRHSNKVSVSSCFLMKIDKGCLQHLFSTTQSLENTLAVL